MSCGTTITLGVFTQGEKPAPLVYQFLDSAGVPINLTGYTVRFNFGPVGGAAVSNNGSLVDAALGKVQYTWGSNDFPTAGQYQAQFWVGNGTNRFASDLITWSVRTSVGTVPII